MLKTSLVQINSRLNSKLYDYLLIRQTGQSSHGRSAGRSFLKPFFLNKRTFFYVSAQNFHHHIVAHHWLRKFSIVFQSIIIQGNNVLFELKILTLNLQPSLIHMYGQSRNLDLVLNRINLENTYVK